jgi:protein involved in polysaccharide export with SLBB domain
MGLVASLPGAMAQQEPPRDQFRQQEGQRYPPPATAPIAVPLPSQPPYITNAPTSQPGIATPRMQERPPVAQPKEPSSRAEPEQRLEFQDLVALAVGRELPRFGRELFGEVPSTFAPLDQIAVPADYVVGPGDEIAVRAWGQLDIDYRAVVDRDGRIYIPKVGSIAVAGLPYQSLETQIRKALARVFRNFELSVALGQLRSIQVFVVGHAKRPGSYVISSLSTLVNALFASGGPSPKGSTRGIQLKRGKDVVTEFDLYDLLLRGDKSKDARLLPGDVIFIPPVGPLAAIAGSVNVPAIYEIKPRTTVQQLINMAGGLSATADGSSITLERIHNRRTRVVDRLALVDPDLGRSLADGDIINVHTLSPRIRNAVTLRGNVAETIRLPWREGMRIRDLIPEPDVLVVPGYWLRKNLSGRSESWLRDAREPAEAERRVGQDADPERRPEREGERRAARDPERRDPVKIRNDLVRGSPDINWDYAVIERFDATALKTQLLPFNLGDVVLKGDQEQNLPLMPGDIITVFSASDIQVPQAKQSKYIRLEGEFKAPGVYQILPGETLRKLLQRVGGATDNAYMYGAEFTRESTRREQQQRLHEAIDRLELEAQRAALARSQGVIAPEQAQSLSQQAAAQTALLAKLRAVQATGRIVLGLPSSGAKPAYLPDLTLEDGDRLYLPPKPGTVSVFGAVYNQNSYLYDRGATASHYLSLAGGPTKDADRGSIYLVRADGSVISSRQRGWFGNVNSETMMPGDAVVVPENFQRFNLTKELKDWTQIFFQFALGVAGLKVLHDL